MPPAGFEPAIPVGDRPQTHALDRSATGIENADVGGPISTEAFTAYIFRRFRNISKIDC